MKPSTWERNERMIFFISNPYSFHPFSCWISYTVTSFGNGMRPDETDTPTINVPLGSDFPGGSGIKLPDVRAAP
jgi:hypothetical protein